MKLLDNLKNLFMDEVDEDEEIELEEEEQKEYKEPKDVLPKVMRDTIEKEEIPEFKPRKRESASKKEEASVLPIKPKEEEKKISFPIDFESDFNYPQKNNVNVLELEYEKEAMKKETVKKTELYPPKKDEVKEKPKFRATPVISPVYGILDKNYKKEEVKEKPDEVALMKRPSKKVDFETVRKKAFGNLADEIKDNILCENCELYKEVKKISSFNEDDLLYEMTQDDEPVTIKKAYDNYEEFGVAYEPKKEEVKQDDDNETTVTIESTKVKVTTTEDDLLSDIISNDTKEEIKEEEKIETPKEETPKVPSRQEKKKETKVDEDFFDLIDSMYKERNEE